jgi:ubiquinone/menaquinone biosynthesis C-methylase UbiE
MMDDLESRVEREKAAHTGDDVLGNSYKLKSFFSHTTESATMRRMHADFESVMADMRGCQVLEIGCGHGDFALKLLRSGVSRVAGIDISDVYVADAAGKSAAAGFPAESYDFKVMDAHHLEYDANQFDYVVGHGILHHLDLEVCLAEIRRVLKPGGRALFIEPLAGNPLLRLFRVLTPAARTVDEKPLDSQDLRRIAAGWDVGSRYYGMFSAPVAAFTSLALRPFPNNPLLGAADWLEQRLAGVVALQSFHQYVMLVLRKRGEVSRATGRAV